MPIRSTAKSPAGMDPERIACAAIAIVGSEFQAQLADREVELAESTAIGERHGIGKTLFVAAADDFRWCRAFSLRSDSLF